MHYLKSKEKLAPPVIFHEYSLDKLDLNPVQLENWSFTLEETTVLDLDEV